jgi:cytochrome c553
MKTSALTLLIAAALATGCSELERSRDLANPLVTARTMAQQVCSNCHGMDGNSVSPNFPRLAGQTASYIVAQLNNFRSHQRSDPAGVEHMWGLSRSLSDAQIAGLGDYYAGQEATRPEVPSADARLLAEGKDIYERGVPSQNVIACQACHGPMGQGIEAFPRLAFQHADYLVKQLDVFQSSQGRPNTAMEYVVHPLTGDNKAAVAAYLQAFPD